jgi:archaemetzincin
LDWRAQQREPGQTFGQLVAAKPHRPDGRRDKIYLQPLGEIPPGEGPSLQKLRDFTAAFFQMDVVLRPPLDLPDGRVTSRRNPLSGNRQLRTDGLLKLLAEKLPQDAYAMLVLTMEDLYPGETWNFVFGQASLDRRVGVYSLARYDPRFYREERPSDWRTIALRRSCKVLAHETGHMFGIRHCTFYRCAMNGSNSLEETDLAPLDLCPIDLRKLHHSLGFDVIDRYDQLLAFSEREGFAEDAAWLRRRLGHLRSR